MMAVIDVGFSGLGFSVGASVAVLFGSWQWSLRVSQQSAWLPAALRAAQGAGIKVTYRGRF